MTDAGGCCFRHCGRFFWQERKVTS
jgi:hypothetical protein